MRKTISIEVSLKGLSKIIKMLNDLDQEDIYVGDSIRVNVPHSKRKDRGDGFIIDIVDEV